MTPRDSDPIERLRKIDPERDASGEESDSWDRERTRVRAVAKGQLPGERGPRRRRRLAPVAAVAGLAAIAAVTVLLLSGNGALSDPAEPAFAQSAIRVAEGNPRLLVTEPGWKVTYVDEFEPDNGYLDFRNGEKGVALSVGWSPAEQYYDPLARRGARLGEWTEYEIGCMVKAESKAQATQAAGMLRRTNGKKIPMKLVPDCHGRSRISKIEVNGIPGTLQETQTLSPKEAANTLFQLSLEPTGPVYIHINANELSRTEFINALESMKAVTVDQWLNALPEQVVRPLERPEVVDEMLVGLPVPESVDVEALRSESAAQARYQVGTAVSGAIACGWLDQWVEATGTDKDPEAAYEAEQALESSRDWPILRELAPKGGWSDVVWEYADEVRRGERAELLDSGGTETSPDGSVYEVGPSYATGLGCDSEQRTLRTPAKKSAQGDSSR